MNWGAWCQGLISALASGVITALGTITIIPGKTTFKELILIAAVPTIISFFLYVKQTPPPIGVKP